MPASKIVLMALSILASAPALAAPSPRWHIQEAYYATHTFGVGTVKYRQGYFEESPHVPFRGHILYLEGLGDSMLNHEPLFTVLADAGYRVIAFDYLGQGGSEGSMNQMRVLDSHFPRLQISALAERAWDSYKKARQPTDTSDTWKDERIVIGWSTGGLAAYEMAHRGWADRVILLAPGVHPKWIVGDWTRITMETLTSVGRPGEYPHVDPIRPKSPLEAPLFAANLLATARRSADWKIPAGVRGLVLMAGDNDAYVHSQETAETIAANAPHFKIVTYADSLHEIDNEAPRIRDAGYAEILDFLKNP